MPKVTILIPTYNALKYLPDAINSALNQTYNDFEILVIDDGSTDATKEYLELIKKENPNKIRFLYQENRGLAVARNKGIELAKGEYIALLDADDIFLPERLKEQVKILDNNPNIGLVHANITKINNEGKLLDTPKRDKKYLSGSIFEYIFLRKAHISCPTVLFRKDCCLEVGVFDSELTRLGCEDRDLWLRISQKYLIHYIPKVLALYRLTNNSMSQNQDKMLKARLYVVDKYFPQNSANSTLRSKALSKIYKDCADSFLINKNYKDSRFYYIKSLKSNLLNPWSWINLIKSFIRI